MSPNMDLVCDYTFSFLYCPVFAHTRVHTQMGASFWLPLGRTTGIRSFLLWKSPNLGSTPHAPTGTYRTSPHPRPRLHPRLPTHPQLDTPNRIHPISPALTRPLRLPLASRKATDSGIFFLNTLPKMGEKQT